MQSLVAAAHELKTPLAIIAHLASALEDESLVTPESRRESLQRIQLSAERTMRLIQGLTTSYRLNEQQLSLALNLQPVNINQICEEVAHEITPFAKVHNQTLELQLGQRSQLVVGDKELLHSVLFNLLDNALRHTPPEAEVRMHLRRRSELVRVCVHDSGPGIKASDMAQLKQRLGKQTQPIVTRSSGSGLGLYIAQQLAGAMGGRVGVGTVKSGADFHVDLLRSTQLSFI
ncbi:MAG TPA: HAMP domain-containing sensor histidine kinase [Candidatus Saccharimonadales bacterium]|nr:HAMP domain-containing sensor histidine kinase [Candidatus Saccharimonadales bacterium]